MLSPLSREMKDKIIKFYVFSNNGENILCITSDDEVFNFGLFLNMNSKETQLIIELCYKIIKQFFNESNFFLALSCDNQLFILKRYLKRYSQTDKIEFSETFNIQDISCGYYQYLLLTDIGLLFGEGSNLLNQKHLKSSMNSMITSIYCLGKQSFVLTYDGMVYHQEF